MATKRPPKSADLATVKALFAEMRAQRVFVFRGLGLSIQMSQTAWPEPAREAPPLQESGEVPLDQMPIELQGPALALRALRRDPTHPDADIDDDAEQGADLPDE